MCSAVLSNEHIICCIDVHDVGLSLSKSDGTDSSGMTSVEHTLKIGLNHHVVECP